MAGGGIKVGAKRLLGICTIWNVNVLISPVINVWHPTASTCCFRWTDGVGNNSFSKMCVYARCSVRCYRERYVIWVLILWSWQRRIFTLVYAYIYNKHTPTHTHTHTHTHTYIYIYIYTYVNVCTYMHPWAGQLSRYSDWLRAGRFGIESRWGRDFPPVQTGPGAHPASCKMGTGSLPGVKYGRGVLLTTHPLLVPRSWKSRAITLPTLWTTPGL